MQKRLTDKELAQKLGVAESTIRARRSRGRPVDAKPQIRLTPREQYRVARAKGTIRGVAEKYGVSESTVKRLRRVYANKK